MRGRFPSLAQPGARTDFIILNTAFSAVVLAIAPFFVCFVGLPTPPEAAIFALTLVPLIAAVTAARAGRIVAAHCMSASAFAGIGLVLAFWTGGGALAAYPWLVLAGLETATSLDKRTNALATGLLTCAVAAVTWVHTRWLPDESGIAVASAVAVLVALAKGPALVRRIVAARIDSIRLAERGDAIAKASGDAIVGFGRDGLVEWVSDESRALRGADPADYIGRGLFEHVHVADRPCFLQLISDAAHGEATEIARIRMRSSASQRDGRATPSHVWIEMRAHRLPSAGDRPHAVIAVLRDATADYGGFASDSDSANAEQDRETSPSDDVLANASHDLRTPLNAIIGFSEILSHQVLQPADEGTRREYARMIHQSGQVLLDAVDTMLNAKKIQVLPTAQRFRSEPASDQVGHASEQRMKRLA